MERFTEIISTQRIRDNVTGEEYRGLVDDELLNIINNLADENRKLLRLFYWSLSGRDIEDDGSEKKL